MTNRRDESEQKNPVQSGGLNIEEERSKFKAVLEKVTESNSNLEETLAEVIIDGKMEFPFAVEPDRVAYQFRNITRLLDKQVQYVVLGFSAGSFSHNRPEAIDRAINSILDLGYTKEQISVHSAAGESRMLPALVHENFRNPYDNKTTPFNDRYLSASRKNQKKKKDVKKLVTDRARDIESYKTATEKLLGEKQFDWIVTRANVSWEQVEVCRLPEAGAVLLNNCKSELEIRMELLAKASENTDGSTAWKLSKDDEERLGNNSRAIYEKVSRMNQDQLPEGVTQAKLRLFFGVLTVYEAYARGMGICPKSDDKESQDKFLAALCACVNSKEGQTYCVRQTIEMDIEGLVYIYPHNHDYCAHEKQLVGVPLV